MSASPKASDAPRSVFYDMIHSNNAARIRLWLNYSSESYPDLTDELIERKVVKYSDLLSEEFFRANPLRKVPAFIREDGTSVFEASVILDYLEDKYSSKTGKKFIPDTAELRQEMNLLIRLHDLYVASPNCTMPGFAHSQGAMYLTPVATPFVPAVRCIPDKSVRAKKIAELWQQLEYLERHIVGPYVMGSELTLVDFTWYPTTIFMEAMLLRVFEWPDIFRDPAVLPNFSKWWTRLTSEHPPFAQVRQEIYGYWDNQYKQGHFDTIAQVVKDKDYQWTYPVQWTGTVKAMLNYQEPPPEGKRTGRYINCPDKGELVDEHIATCVDMLDARELEPAASLSREGFSFVDNFQTALSQADYTESPEKVKSIYYDEIRALVKAQTGASKVFVFDSTLRHSQTAASLNVTGTTQRAAPVSRVHCDYTETGAPRRFVQLASDDDFRAMNKDEGFPTKEEAEAIVADGRRFAFINIWRSIDSNNPVLERPLAVCDATSVSPEDRFLYELHFPHRVGENYSLNHTTSSKHKWYTFSKMKSNECIIFKVYDRVEPKFVLHTAWNDPRGGFRTPPRQSIEVRTVALF